MGVRLSKLNGQGRRQKKIFWTSTCAGFLKHNSGRNPETGIQCMVYLSPAPHSHAVLNFANGCVLAEPAEDNFARHMRGRYPQQSCGLVEIP